MLVFNLWIIINLHHYFRGHALLPDIYYIQGFVKEELLETTIVASETVVVIYMQYSY
jgi:hypothetical protein